MRNQLDRWLQKNPMPGVSSTKEERAEFFGAMPQRVKSEWEIRKGARECEHPDYNAGIAERAAKRMARVDSMPRELREVVYEYGLEIVQEFLNCGVKVPSRIKHLIDTVRHADLPNGQKRFKINKGANAKRNPVEFEEDDDEYYVIAKR